MRIAIDTNILAYAEGVNGGERRDAVLGLIRRLPETEVIIPAQVLGELYNVLVRKADWRPDDAKSTTVAWKDAYVPAATSIQAMLTAINLAVAHRLRIWDALILAVAAEAECSLLLSEDMQDGFAWNGVIVVNPLAVTLHPLLETVLR